MNGSMPPYRSRFWNFSHIRWSKELISLIALMDIGDFKGDTEDRLQLEGKSERSLTGVLRNSPIPL